jgi:hypothetical protein
MNSTDMNPTSMSCEEFEILLADAVDQTLGQDQRVAFEGHRLSCAACAELAEDVMGAVELIERAEILQVPVELVQKIRAEITVGPSQYLARKPLGERIFGSWFGVLLQPRFAMSLAMAVLSIAILGRVMVKDMSGPVTAGRVWTNAENRVVRSWDRAMKGYDNLWVVTEMRAQLDQMDLDQFRSDQTQQGQTQQDPLDRPGR